MHLRPHEKLVAWREAYRLSLSVYNLTQSFPSHELFGLTSQLRRAVVSVPLNLAEGNAKFSKKERRHYFEIASASLEEVHCCCRLALDLKYIAQEHFHEIDQHIHRTSTLITALRRSLA